MHKMLHIAALVTGLTITTLAARAEEPVQTEVWIDVRSTVEYRAGHRSDAVHLPHTIIGKRIAELDLQKDQPIYLYCRSGSRAKAAKKTLNGLGYTNVKNIRTLEAALARQAKNN